MSITRMRRSREVAFLRLAQLSFNNTEEILLAPSSDFFRTQLAYIIESVTDKSSLSAYNWNYFSQIYNGLVIGFLDFRKSLDTFASSFSYKQMDNVDRTIILLGYLEFTYVGSDKKLCINEMIELAKIYGDEASYKFINGILHSMLLIQSESV